MSTTRSAAPELATPYAIWRALCLKCIGLGAEIRYDDGRAERILCDWEDAISRAAEQRGRERGLEEAAQHCDLRAETFVGSDPEMRQFAAVSALQSVAARLRSLKLEEPKP
jgi:hypothetical protein